jgi:ribonuclease BN (tRNA processing enzyme)
VRLTVLGGSAAGVNTGAGSSGYLLDSGTTRIVLDLGPGTLPELRRHTDFRTLNGIVISHLHLDHVLDLGALRFALAYNPIKPEKRIPVWLPPGGLGLLDRYARTFADAGDEATFFTSVMDVQEYNPTSQLTIGNVVATFSPTVHYIPCWAIRVTAPVGTSLGYTADTGPTAPLAGFFGGVEVLIAESTLTEPDAHPVEQRGHLTASEAGTLASAAGATSLVLSHIWEERGFERVEADASATFVGRVIVAHAGVTVDW